MAVTRSTLLRDVILFIKNDLNSNITDPISGSRSGSSAFVMTSFPQRNVKYPMVTIKVVNVESLRAGMQTTAMDTTLTLELRVWGRNQKEKDEIYTQMLDRLASIQFTVSTGSVANNLHDFNILSSIEIDEEGKGGMKSRILQCEYKFFE